MQPAEAEELLAAIPPVHVALLVLRAAGASDRQIAEQLEVEIEAIGGLAEVATRKARRLLGSPDGGSPDDGQRGEAVR